MIYTSISGLKVEIYTDVFQGILMLLFLGLLFFVDLSAISLSSINPYLNDSTLAIGALSFGAAQFLTTLVQPELWQRFYTVEKPNDMKKGLFSSFLIIFLFIIPLILIGIVFKVNGGEQNPQTLFYDIIKTSAPISFLPFLSIAMFAAFMSSIDSSLFAVSSQIGKFGISMKSNKNEDIEVKNTRISLIFMTVFTVITSLFFGDFLSHVIQLLSLSTVLATTILYSIVRKLSQQAVLSALFFGIVAFTICAYSGFITDDPTTVLYPSIFTFFLLIVLDGYRVISSKLLT